ncbi:MAG: thioesterase [Candidatus Marinimicrobia bacterium]|nr:thioesterase [Candidatus Neomarinimicrobiota bacterium]
MKFHMPFQVRVYECDPRGALSLPSLLNYMQEIAAAHTVKLHITIPELLPRGLTWMVSRQHIAIERYPEYMDKVSISTWIADHRGRFSIRDFALEDASGKVLIRISSSWVLYDIRKHCIVNVDEELPLDSVFPERALDDKFHSPSCTRGHSIQQGITCASFGPGYQPPRQ